MKNISILFMVAVMFACAPIKAQLKPELEDPIRVSEHSSFLKLYGSKVELLQRSSKVIVAYQSPEYLVHKHPKNKDRVKYRANSGLLQIQIKGQTIGGVNFSNVEIRLKNISDPTKSCLSGELDSQEKDKSKKKDNNKENAQGCLVDNTAIVSNLSELKSTWVNNAYVLLHDYELESEFKVFVKIKGISEEKYNFVVTK